MRCLLPVRCVCVAILAALSVCSGCSGEKRIAGPEAITEEAVLSKTPEFILGPGDKIDINVYRHDDLKKTVQIDLSGRISYPLLGDIQVAGLGVFELRDKIRDGLVKYIMDPQVSVSVSSSQSQKLLVLGEVKTPGFFQVDTPVTALEAISRAGGYTLDGRMESVLLIRGDLKKPQLIALNLEKALHQGDLAQNMLLQRGDILYVPRTFISDVDRFFTHLQTIVQPLVLIETGIFLDKQIEHSSKGVSVAP
jgi:polysaccharide export outer membrane protein